MTHIAMTETDAREDLLLFTPVPLQRRRRDGWTPAVQRAFILTLSRCGVVTEAARSVGCTARSAYQLRARAGAESFAAAWDWAIEMGLDAMRDRAMERIAAIRERPLIRRGRIVGVRKAEDHRLLYLALRALDAEPSGRRALMPHRQRIGAREFEEALHDQWRWDPAVPRPAHLVIKEPG